MTIIRKAVFPVAGLGTRFLPATKATPKEMLPIVDKPLIQYAVEEAIQAGITELIFVTCSNKRIIEDHFDSSFELEKRLAEKNGTELLKIVKNILPAGAHCIYVRQPEPLGLGHAILCAESVVGNEPFAVLLADDLIDSGTHPSCVKQMVTAFQQYHGSLIAVQKIARADISKYGIVDINESVDAVIPVKGIVEKPQPENAPSEFGAIGRYVLTPNIFQCLHETSPGKGNEIQLTDAIAKLISQEKTYAFKFNGKRYDCGNKFGYVQATIDYALKHPECHEQLKNYLHQLQHE